MGALDIAARRLSVTVTGEGRAAGAWAAPRRGPRRGPRTGVAELGRPRSHAVRHWVVPPNLEGDIELVAISEDQFSERMPRLKAGYAEHLRATGMSAERAAEKSEEVHARLLPDGQPRHQDRLLTVLVGGVPGGLLWLGPLDDEPGVWWVWQIEVDETLRGRGVGRAAMKEAAEVVRAGGGHSLGLDVFGDNLAARRLYDSLGFRTTKLQMRLAF